MTETLISILYGLSFLVSLILIGFLWWLAYRFQAARRFYQLLATAWTLNVLSSMVWGFYVTFIGEDIPDLINVLFFVRYAFVMLALWSYPAVWPFRRALEILGVMLVAAMVLWFGFVQPLRAATGQLLTYVLEDAIFPLLDAGIVYAAWVRWRNAPSGSLRSMMGMLSLSMLAYGIANWLNFRVRAVSPDADSMGAMILWLLTDVFAIIGAWQFLRHERSEVTYSRK